MGFSVRSHLIPTAVKMKSYLLLIMSSICLAMPTPAPQYDSYDYHTMDLLEEIPTAQAESPGEYDRSYVRDSLRPSTENSAGHGNHAATRSIWHASSRSGYIPSEIKRALPWSNRTSSKTRKSASCSARHLARRDLDVDGRDAYHSKLERPTLSVQSCESRFNLRLMFVHDLVCPGFHSSSSVSKSSSSSANCSSRSSPLSL